MFNEIALQAANLTDASVGVVFIQRGDEIHLHSNGPDRDADVIVQSALEETTVLVKVLGERTTASFDDQSVLTDPTLRRSAEAAREFGIKSAAYVPLPAGGPAVGAAVMRSHVEPFTPEQLAMLETFAAQAGNAVTNARLVADIEERNAELAEALALQTATSEILELISANPGDLSIVLDGVLTKAVELIGADQGVVLLSHGELVRVETAVGAGAAIGLGNEFRRDDVPWLVFDEPAFIEDRTVDVPDEPTAAFFRRAGVRSSASFPLEIDGRWIGQINLSRTEVRPFDARQAAILQTFADQAAIAIRNAGLFNDLDEALQLQTATSEVLALISEHPGDRDRVLSGLLARAVDLCDAQAGSVSFGGQGNVQFVASHGKPMEPYVGVTTTADPFDRSIMDAYGPSTYSTSDFTDLTKTQHPYWQEMALQADVRSYAFSMFEGGPNRVVTLHVFRQEVRPFSDVELGRLEAFAQQASLAIANADLFNDLDESLALQTATSEVLELISAHPGELDVVLEGIIERTTRLVDATVGLLWLRAGDDLVCRAQMPSVSQSPEQWVGTSCRRRSFAPMRGRPSAVDQSSWTTSPLPSPTMTRTWSRTPRSVRS